MIILYFSIILVVYVTYFFYRAKMNTHEVSIKNVHLEKNTNEVMNVGNKQILRVLQLSDLHLEHLSISADRLYASLKDESYDLIAITGDFLDRPRSIPKLEPYLRVVEKLKPRYGTYAVFGNHDYKLRHCYFEQLKKLLSDYNIKTMQNENDTIYVKGYAVHIIGIDDHHSKRNDVSLAYQGLKGNAYQLVLTHDPNIVMQMEDREFDYMLTGHFHGGQICWPKPYHLMKFGKLVRLNMIKGLIHYKGKDIYINEGLGQTGINIRIGSRPEITIHEITIAPSFSRSEANMAAS